MIVSVAVNVPARQLFDYRAEGRAGDFLGRRVRVEFGRRKISGVVLAEREDDAEDSAAAQNLIPSQNLTSPQRLTAPQNLKPRQELNAPQQNLRQNLNPQRKVQHIKLKPVLEVYSDMPPLPPDTLALIRFCAAYYHAPIGLAAAAVLPAAFRRASIAVLASGYRLAENAAALPPRRKTTKKTAETVQKIFTLLNALNENEYRAAEYIRQKTGASAALLRRLAQEGLLIRGHCWPELSDAPPDAPPSLTADQERALAQTETAGGYAPHLLFGATGSGKTEIYLRLAEKILSAGGRALILTPEINLTPQLEASFARRFPARRLSVLHSGLTDGERARRWLMAREGAADIVLGTRLAVFTPLPRLRLIVVDEEHDDSYKQSEGGMQFSARDVAVWRASRAKIPLVCGSATPSLESYENARRGRYRLLRMNARPSPGKLSKTLCAESGALFHGMTQQFLSELGETLTRGEQALVFVNRRGYSPMLVCQTCRWAVMCRACEARMTWHKRRGRMLCHRCGGGALPPLRCESCGGEMRAAGIGTQRIEDALNARFAPVRAVRLDGDSLSARGSFAALREQIASGEAQLLVGTQIVAKGHNFPRLSFIGILNADAGLWAADFRAEERLLMQLWQVIGRGTRNAKSCRALIQTAKPEHPFYQSIVAGNLEECWRRLSEERRRAKLPPFSYCALLRASAHSEPALRDFFAKAARAAAAVPAPRVRFFSPAPSPQAKAAGRWHWQLLAQSESRAELRRFLEEWRDSLPPSGKVRWHFDIDPLQI
ncbi:MAG: replication restart helicase PriA [Gammaproteobacteria bacterium]